ncbi:MAG: NAD(P)-dependent oxidoreductase [Roseomonas sp.]|nr:NAD(P)-dependent oxidoreductase [Roseomonas sp.]
MEMERIGFLGLGAMGGPIATRMADWAQRNPGKRILVFDPRPEAMQRATEAGAEPMGSVAAVAQQCKVVFACLPSAETSERVALGAEGIAGAPGAVRIYVEMSTIGSAAMQRIATGLSEKGIALIDCPISGGVHGAESGALAVIASGAPEVLQEVMPLLQVVGRTVFTIGDTPGLSQTMKLANNLLSLAGMVLTSEAFALGAKAGIDTALMCDVINASTGRNSSTVTKFPRAVLTGKFSGGASNAIVSKDLSLAVAEFSAFGLSAPMAALAREMLSIAKNRFGPDADMTSVAQLYEEWAGVKMQSPNLVKSAG